MGTKKISELEQLSNLKMDDVFPVVDTENVATKKITYQKLLKNIIGIKPFDTTIDYTAGDLCIYDNKIYMKNQVTPPIYEWREEYWDEITIEQTLKELKIYHDFEEEVVIGRWIDGSKIYRRVIKLNNTTINAGNNYRAHSISNFKKCTHAELLTQTEQYLFPYIFASTYKVMGITEVDSSNICIRSEQQWGQDSFYVILEYTKTVD